ncbi:DNA repair protein RecN [Arsenicicoccus piscis]|uniref:DNA repair protein RecN n=1 Tax=Arsenicicoccus piscis TaxID=673954 RepID=A0ABQ6HKZ4_9MICO|nr:DNA repair protein RecN [Arsenicicoccus piscis]MCH8627048.1 DNA repair protein RecN [Arsenicicoccus piscis]GMA19017.1 DNA repair protein RecN [Arsenicicoccus piscis]
MLQQIRITGLGVIDDAVLDLSPGLNVITGETGAGKTMVLTGLGLLLGERADAARVRSGARRTLVEGVALLPLGHPVLERADEAGAETEDGELIVARSVSAEGRSRAHLGGRTVPIGVLAEVGQELVAVHGQADQLRLRSPEQHRALLDSSDAAVLAALAAYEPCYERVRSLVAERDRLQAEATERARELELLSAGLTDIEAVDPHPGEDDELKAEDARLSHADALRDSAARAHALLVGGDSDWDAGESAWASVTAGLASAGDALREGADLDPEMETLAKRASELGYLATDLGADVASYLAGVEVDPARLEQVQLRRAELGRLSRRYADGGSVADVIAWSREAAATVSTLRDADERLPALDAEVEQARADLEAAGERLHTARVSAAQRLGRRATAEVRRLAMPKATISARITPTGQLARHGGDEVAIELAANPGAPARSVVKAASGGELSRVMLALEVATRMDADGVTAVPTFVFDEVDAGVGGKAATEVGRRLAELARTAQVVVVTHLAQVAAFADRHLVVEKSDDGTIAASGVHVVEGDQRLHELARLMAGDTSATAVEHARELLGSSRPLPEHASGPA